MHEIHEEIAKLEKCDCTTYDVCRKLAILYIVREHYGKNGGNETNTMATTMRMSSPSMMADK